MTAPTTPRGPYFGPRVLGEAEYQRQLASYQTDPIHTGFGPRVTGGDTPKPAPEPEGNQYRLSDLTDILQNAPDQLDALIALERQRPKMRPQALKLFLATEAASEHPRDDVIVALTEWMT